MFILTLTLTMINYREQYNNIANNMIINKKREISSPSAISLSESNNSSCESDENDESNKSNDSIEVKKTINKKTNSGSETNEVNTATVNKGNGDNVQLNKFFTKKELCCYAEVNNYFHNICTKGNIHLMRDIISSTSRISLRILEWFTAKHSKRRSDICYRTNELCDELGDEFDIRISYDAQLKSYKKKNFDVFKRGKKFLYGYDKNNITKKIETTLGQLNFFKWGFENNIIDIVRDNLEKINNEMKKDNNSIRKAKKKKKEKEKKNKKKNINISAKKINDLDDEYMTYTIEFK